MMKIHVAENDRACKQGKVMRRPSVNISRYITVGLIQFIIRETQILFIRDQNK